MTQFLTDYLFDADFSINFSQLTLYLDQISIIFPFQRVTVAPSCLTFITDGTSRYVLQIKIMYCYYFTIFSYKGCCK